MKTSTAAILIIFSILLIATVYHLQPAAEARPRGSGSIVKRGTVSFTVSSDPAGRHPINSIEWGVITIGTKNTRTLYIVNRGNTWINCDFSLSGWSWSTIDPSKDLQVTIKFSASSPLGPNRFRLVTIEQTQLRTINTPQTILSYKIVITATQAK